MVFSDYTKRRILYHHAQGHRAPTIVKLLQDEGLVTSRRGVYAFLLRMQETGGISRCPGSGRPSKTTDEVKEAVEAEMRDDDETTVKELHKTGDKMAIIKDRCHCNPEKMFQHLEGLGEGVWYYCVVVEPR